MMGQFFQIFFGGVLMRRVLLCGLTGFAFCALLSTAALAGGHSAADYPMRVHIFQFNAHSAYSYRQVDYVDGEGRANLFENGNPLGFDFSYRCSERLRVSAGYETYPARWKKPGKEIEILLPQFGKPGAMSACNLEVLMKDNEVYVKHNGLLGEEPVARFKEWMDKHQYDPEHGKDLPVAAAPEPKPAQTPAGTGTSAPR